jgi:hypothetical protein
MNAVMEITGGRLFTKLWPSNQVALWDANQPVQFECEQVEQVPSTEGMRANTNAKSDNGSSYTLAYGVTIDSSGKLSYRLERTAEGFQKANVNWSQDFYCSYMMLRLTEWQARNMENWNFFIDRQPTLIDFRKFALDLKDPYGLGSMDDWSEGFLRLK